MRNRHAFFALCLALIMMLALALPVAADVIVEPDNLFYATHRKECEYIRARHYLTNSDQGHVYLYQSPDNRLSVRSFPNGEKVTLTWLYTASDGEVWGIIADESGWFRISDLSLIYDSQEFLKDNADKCLPFDRSTHEPIVGSEETPVLSWTYPGGKRAYYDIQSGNVVEFVSTVYTDENGTLWGHIVYMYGMRDFWVCLSEPYDDSVGGTALEEHVITLRREPTAAEDIPIEGNRVTMLILSGVLIAVVVVSTVVILRVMFVKKKQK